MPTDIDPNALTLALLLTTSGALGVATFITGFVAVLTRLIPAIAGNEARAAAVLAGVLVLLLAVSAVVTAAMPVGIPLLLAVVFAWYAVTRLSMSIYDDLANKPASLRSQTTDSPGS